MGHANTKEALSSEYQRALSKFQKTEIKVLEETFRDLAARSDKKTIDKTTFLRVFNLPGMLGERLFAIFDRSKKGSIDWPEFVCGLGWFARGTMDEKIEFIFRMYDLGGDNMISKQELETMLNSVVLAASTILNTTMFSRRKTRKPDPSAKLPDDGSHRDSGEETDSEESSNAGSNDEHDSEFDAAHPFRLPCVTSSNLNLQAQKSQKDLLSEVNTTAPPTSSSSSSSVQDQSNNIAAQLPPTGQPNSTTQFTVSLASSEVGAPTIASISSTEQTSSAGPRPRITVTTAPSGAVGGHSESSDETPSRSQSTSPGLHEDLSPHIAGTKTVPATAAAAATRSYPPPPINVHSHNGPPPNFPRNAVNRPPLGYSTLPIGRGNPIASSTSYPDLRRASAAGLDDGGYLSASSVASASDRERGSVGPGSRHHHSLSTFSHGTLGRSGILPHGGSFGIHEGGTPQRFGHNRRRPTASRGKLEERVKKMVNDAFTHSGVNPDGKLSLAQFKEWAKSYPEVLQVIFAAFGGGVRGPGTSAAHPHPAHEPGEPRQRWSVMDIISPLSSKDTTPPSLLGSRAASETVHSHGHHHTRESMMAHGSSFSSLPHNSMHAPQPSLALPTMNGQPHSRTNSFNGIIDAGSPPDSARAGSPNRGVEAPDSPREHVPFHAGCSNCGFEAKISHCYKCGKSLVRRGPDAGCCRNCGLIFQDNAMSFCMQCGHDLAVMIIEPPLVKTIDYALREQKLFERFLHEGYLWKVGSRFKQLVQRWFCLQDSFLYSFTKRDDVKPSHVLLLEGSFVENVDDSEVNSKLKWGFKIIVGEDEKQHRTLYANSEAERDEWVKAIQLHAGTHNIEDYYTLQPVVLGKGRYSTVVDGVNKVSSKHYAIKVINKDHMDEKEKEALRTEIAVLKLVDHPSIVQLKNVFETRKQIFLVMSMASGGDLFDRLAAKSRFSEHVSRELIFTILHVIKYLHERGIVHRDLKPENILCRSKEIDTDIVVGDFGLSKFTTPSEIMNLPCGTIAYVAPEVLNGQGYGFEVDLWSVGVMLYIFIRGQFPFYGQDKESMVKSITEGKISFSHPLWSTVSNECKDLLKNLLLVDPHARYTVDQALAHPWFKIKLRVATPKFRSTPTDYKQASLNPQALNLPAQSDPSQSSTVQQLEVPGPLTMTDRQTSIQSDSPSPRTVANTAANANPSGFAIAGQSAPAPLLLPNESPPGPRTPVKVTFSGDSSQPPPL